MVTHNELRINGQKPNFPSEGAQSEEEIKLKKLLSFKSPVDFSIKPVPIASGRIKKKLRHAIIHLDEILSVNFLESTIVVKFNVWVELLYIIPAEYIFAYFLKQNYFLITASFFRELCKSPLGKGTYPA